MRNASLLLTIILMMATPALAQQPPAHLLADQEAPTTAFQLHQNYPNPFEDRTTITYELRQPGYVKFSVYNMLGRKVIDLVDGKQEAGRHTVAWNGKDLDGTRVVAGMYLYRLEAGGARSVRTMVLLG